MSKTYWITPLMSLNAVDGESLSLTAAVRRIEDGERVVVRSEETVRQVLSHFGLNDFEVDNQVHFGKTGSLL